MITPWEILTDPVSIAVLAMYALLMIWEAVFPAQKLPQVKYWKFRGMAAFAFFFFLSSYLPLFIDPYLEPYRLFDLTNLTTLIGGLVGVCLYEFGVYVWHRALHNSDFLWRTFHQMHHSAERLDTYGAFYFSPMDMIGWTVLGSICFALLVGLSPQAITVTLLVTNFMGMFQHANIKTAPWLGYIIQRPESHTVHHAQGIHKYNYSDLPIFDILFGTFKNPTNYEHRTGLFYGASAKVLDMLCFKDLIKERKKKKVKREAVQHVKKVVGLLLFISISIGCSKDEIEGPQGPVGEQGLQGEQGTQGEPGQDGADGKDGNAEVMYSNWISANFTGTSASTKYMNIDFPSNVPRAFSIKSTHVILVYFSGFGDSSTYLLPILDFRGAQFTYGFGSGSASVGDILIKAKAHSGDLNEYQISPARGNKFRYVIIPPTINISGKSSLDYGNYEEVKAFYNIPD
ncbi:sterol desaturase family protein [Flagellimonas sp. 2504JD4-2]